LKKEEAEEYTQSLGQIVGGAWRQIALAKKIGVPKALGLDVDEWVREHLGGYVKMAGEDMRAAIDELTAEGESNVQIGKIIGVDERTVRRIKTADSANAEEDVAETAENSHSDTETSANAEPDILDTVAAMAATQKVKEEADRQTKKDEQKAANAELIAAPVVWPEGVYPVIVIDPPWPMEKIERDVAPKQAGFDYPTMSLEEIEAFDLNRMAADDCHLFMWTTHKFIVPAFKILETWGFKYVSTFVWHKPGGFQPFGLPQYNCEFALYARKGTPKFRETKAFPTCFSAPRGKHSEKPKEFYAMISRVTDGPRMDVFNRQERDGFEVYGNETDKL